jgi:hypothetical protein
MATEVVRNSLNSTSLHVRFVVDNLERFFSEFLLFCSVTYHSTIVPKSSITAPFSVTHNLRVLTILSCSMCDYRRGLDW